MPLTHIEKFKVRYTECDQYGHVNNVNYLRYMQEAAFDASAAAGYAFKRYDELGQYWLVRETEIEYLKPLTYGDEFELKTWVVDFRRVRPIDGDHTGVVVCDIGAYEAELHVYLPLVLK